MHPPSTLQLQVAHFKTSGLSHRLVLCLRLAITTWALAVRSPGYHGALGTQVPRVT